MRGECTTDGCRRPAARNGRCWGHYRNNGSELRPYRQDAWTRVTRAFDDYAAADPVADPVGYHRKKERLRLEMHRYVRANKPQDPRRIGRRRRQTASQ
jgi:hypothetical protein